MPIYEYVCTQCGSEIEVIQRFTDPPLEKCSSCSGKLQKKISASTFHLKGSGWYVTDYARKNTNAGNGNGKAAKETASAETKSADSAPAKTETPKAEPAKDTSGKTESGSSAS